MGARIWDTVFSFLADQLLRPGNDSTIAIGDGVAQEALVGAANG